MGGEGQEINTKHGTRPHRLEREREKRQSSFLFRFRYLRKGREVRTTRPTFSGEIGSSI